jgi:hypothetical protein
VQREGDVAGSATKVQGFLAGLDLGHAGQELLPTTVKSKALQIVDKVVARRKGAEESFDQGGPLLACTVILVAHVSSFQLSAFSFFFRAYVDCVATMIQAGPRSDLLIVGMTCANCAHNVTDALQGVPGVASANVPLATPPKQPRRNPKRSRPRPWLAGGLTSSPDSS